MELITNTNQYATFSFSHPLYKDNYNLLSDDSKKEITKEINELFEKGLQGFNGYKERFIKNRVEYWKTVEEVSRKTYFEVMNHANGYKTTNERLSALSGIPQQHPDFEKILTDAAARILILHDKCKAEFKSTYNNEPMKKKKKSFIAALFDKSDKFCFTAGAVLCASGLYNLIAKNSDLIKAFFSEAMTKTSVLIGQTRAEDAVTLLASGVAVVGGAKIIKSLLEPKNAYASDLVKSKLEERTR